MIFSIETWTFWRLCYETLGLHLRVFVSLQDSVQSFARRSRSGVIDGFEQNQSDTHEGAASDWQGVQATEATEQAHGQGRPVLKPLRHGVARSPWDRRGCVWTPDSAGPAPFPRWALEPGEVSRLPERRRGRRVQVARVMKAGVLVEWAQRAEGLPPEQGTVSGGPRPTVPASLPTPHGPSPLRSSPPGLISSAVPSGPL